MTTVRTACAAVVPSLGLWYKRQMADRWTYLPADSGPLRGPGGTNAKGSGGGQDQAETYQVEAVVVVLIPEFHQVQVRDDAGHLYALTRKTRGVDLDALHEGQKILCTVTTGLHRVLNAAAVA